jgi:tRNA modification GTPase
LRAQLALLQGQTRQGALLRDGLKVVIAGQPNAGKSSLLNALAGAELAIVTPIAGTTRDTVGQIIQIEGVPLHMVDTAGLRESDEPVETLGIARAWHAIGSADVVLFVHDLERQAQLDYQEADREISAQLTEALSARIPVIHVWNKCDSQHVTPAARVPDASNVLISAKTGAGLDDLRQRLLQAVGWQADTGARFSARQRHVQALGRVDAHLAQADTQIAQAAQALDLLAEELRLAHNALGEITGAFTADDLLGVIFSSFCIGK